LERNGNCVKRTLRGNGFRLLIY